MRTLFNINPNYSETKETVPLAWQKMLAQLLSLDAGWNAMRDAASISAGTADAAKRAMFLLRDRGFSNFRLQPGIAGEILIIADMGGLSCEIIATTELRYELYLEEAGEEISAPVDLTYQQLVGELNKKCGMSEFSILSTMIQESANSAEWPLDREVTAGYPSLQWTARSPATGLSAPISQSTTAQ